MENYTELELIDIGLGFFDTYKYAQSIEFFTKAILLNPQSSQAYELRGLAWLQLMENEKAIADTETAINLDPENFNALANLAGIYLGKQDCPQAEIYYQKSLQFFPESIQNLSSLAYSQLNQKKYTDCIQSCNQILQLSVNDPWALMYRNAAYGGQKMYTEAIADCMVLLDVYPDNNGSTYINIGYYHSKLGNTKEARVYLEKALAINPDSAYGHNDLGFVYYLEHKYQDALHSINHSISLDASNSYAYKNRAKVYLALGQRDLALKDLQKAQLLGYSLNYDNEVNDLLLSEFNL